MNTEATSGTSGLSYLAPTPSSPRGTYLAQIDRVATYLGSLARWVDILIPPALEGQVTAARTSSTAAKLVLEGANVPTVAHAHDILAERGGLVVPDVICNAGRVTVSCFEWVQDASSLFGTSTTSTRASIES